MATLTYTMTVQPAGGFSFTGWPFTTDTITPFSGVKPIPFAGVLQKPDFTPNGWPFNGGTLQPAGAGRILYTFNNFYWGQT